MIAGKCRDPDYPEEQFLREIADKGNIKYLGYRGDIQNIYKTSDIVVVPSQWEEPFGLINIEAGACRKPVIATRVGGIPEVIKHGENGFLVEKDDLDSLAEYTGRLIDDKALGMKLGDNGRGRVETYFTDAPIRQLEGIYNELIGSR